LRTVLAGEPIRTAKALDAWGRRVRGRVELTTGARRAGCGFEAAGLSGYGRIG